MRRVEARATRASSARPEPAPVKEYSFDDEHSVSLRAIGWFARNRIDSFGESAVTIPFAVECDLFRNATARPARIAVARIAPQKTNRMKLAATLKQRGVTLAAENE